MSDKTSLGDRMKQHETRASYRFMPLLPIIARLDGKAFHTFTKGLKRPYDEQLSSLMVMTTQYLVQETNARCGYTQSDEITLVWLSENDQDGVFFDAKLQKMNSILASMCTAFFNRHLAEFLPEKAKELPLFDCRVFQVPTEFEATNCFIWREQDATRNSVQMAARAYFSHNECHEKSGPELQEMLWQREEINWNDFPAFFKRGTYIRRKIFEKLMSDVELAKLPEKHHARQNPDLVVKRSVVERENFPPLVKIINREAVILHGAEPVLRSDKDDVDN